MPLTPALDRRRVGEDRKASQGWGTLVSVVGPRGKGS